MTPKKLWYLNGLVAGNTKAYKNFVYVMVYGAGHMVPTD